LRIGGVKESLKEYLFIATCSLTGKGRSSSLVLIVLKEGLQILLTRSWFIGLSVE